MPRTRRYRASGAARSAPIALLVASLLLACSPTAPSETPAQQAIALPLVVDTDMAPDDIVAIASLLRDPAVRVRAITVAGTGEAHCQGGMFVARAIVTMLVPDPVTVACGPEEPLGDAQPFPDAWRAGADAGNGLALVSPTFAPDPRPAGQILAELADAEAAEGRRLTILTLGTLTNVADAVAYDPGLPEHVRLVSMLGAIDVPGNVTPDVAGGSGAAVAEWNAHADPTAVQVVLEAGFDWTLIPLDATNSVPLTEELYLDLESDHAAGPADLVFELWSKNPYMRSSGFYLWDPLAAAAVRDAALVETRPASIRVVEGAALDGGQLVEDPAGAPVTVGTAADQEAFEAMLLSRLRLGPPRTATFEPVGTLSVSVGDGSCEAQLPSATPAGLLRVEVENQGAAHQAVFVFGLGTMTWQEVEAFAAAPPPTDGAPPPPVLEVVWVQSPGLGTQTGFGTTTPGLLGVACLSGTEEQPEIMLSGPFSIGP